MRCIVDRPCKVDPCVLPPSAPLMQVLMGTWWFEIIGENTKLHGKLAHTGSRYHQFPVLDKIQCVRQRCAKYHPRCTPSDASAEICWDLNAPLGTSLTWHDPTKTHTLSPQSTASVEIWDVCYVWQSTVWRNIHPNHEKPSPSEMASLDEQSPWSSRDTKNSGNLP